MSLHPSQAPEGSGLRRSLRLTQLFTLGFGMVVGVGWMLLVGDWLIRAGSLGAVAAFVAGAVLIGVIGLCYAEIATAYPEAGGEVVYALRVFGRPAAFAVGWMLGLIYVVISAFEAIGFAWLASIIYPPVNGPVLYGFLGADVHAGSVVIGVAGMAVFGWINYRGAAMAAGVQDLLIYVKIAISLGFVAAGLIGGHTANLAPLFTPPPATPLSGFLAVFITAPFWFAGFGVIPQALGERADDASLRGAGLSIVAVIAAACLFYCLIILAVAMAAPRATLAGAALPAAAAFQMAFHSRLLVDLIIGAGMVGLLTTWNGLFFSSSRILYALGSEGLLPSAFARLSRRGTPASALVFVTLAGALCVAAGKGAITPMVNLTGLVFAAVYLMVCVAVVARRRRGDPPAPFQTPGGAVTATVAAVIALLICIVAAVEIARGPGGAAAPEFLTLGTWIVLGGAFWMAARTRARQP